MSLSGAEPASPSMSPAAARPVVQRVLPAPEKIADGVWALASPIPNGSIRFTLSYLLEGPAGELHLVDPGWGSDKNVDVLRESLLSIGHRLEQLRTIIATHSHPDHLGAAERLRDITGARILFSEVERRVLAQANEPAARDADGYVEMLRGWAVPERFWPELLAYHDQPAWVADIEPDGMLVDADILRLPGHTLRVIATPGHTDGHICLADADRQLLYTGDHVMPRIIGGLGMGTLPGSDPLLDYFGSLEALAPYDGFEVLPGHERRFAGLAERRSRIARHHLRRSAEVAQLTADVEDSSVWDIARQMVWTGGWDSLGSFMLHSALRQTEMHLELVRSGRAAMLSARYGCAESGA